MAIDYNRNQQPDIVLMLKDSKNIAVVGLSTNQFRPAYSTAKYLIQAGYNVIPVNPRYGEVLGLKCYPSLRDVPEKIDIVNVFRNGRHVMQIVEDAIAIAAKVVWTQPGVYNDAAIQKATGAGLTVVDQQCIKIEHARIN